MEEQQKRVDKMELIKWINKSPSPDIALLVLCNEGIEFIIKALEEHLPIADFVNPAMNRKQIQMIYLGLKQGLDVNRWARVEYRWELMDEYRNHQRLGFTVPNELLDSSIDFIDLSCKLYSLREDKS